MVRLRFALGVLVGVTLLAAVAADPPARTEKKEPNNGIGINSNDTGMQRGQRQLFFGAIEPIGDVDTFAFDITGGAAGVIAGTFADPKDPTSCEGLDMQVELVDSTGHSIIADAHSGPGLCPLLHPTIQPSVQALPAGRYYLKVSGGLDLVRVPAYVLAVTIQ